MAAFPKSGGGIPFLTSDPGPREKEHELIGCFMMRHLHDERGSSGGGASSIARVKKILSITSTTPGASRFVAISPIAKGGGAQGALDGDELGGSVPAWRPFFERRGRFVASTGNHPFVCRRPADYVDEILPPDLGKPPDRPDGAHRPGLLRPGHVLDADADTARDCRISIRSIRSASNDLRPARLLFSALPGDKHP